MKILTFDTSTETMYVTIGNDSEALACKVVETTEKSYNSAHLIPIIIEIIKEQGLKPENLDAIGINTGPGSFTGIRASATVAKVIANQLDIPVVGVSSLEIYSCLNKTDKNSLILLDARRGKAYAAMYSSQREVLMEPCALDYEAAVELASNPDNYVICDKKISEMLNLSNIECLNLSEVKENLGIFLAELTYKHLINQTVIARQPEGLTRQSKFSWHNLKPLYIQPPPISTPKVQA